MNRYRTNQRTPRKPSHVPESVYQTLPLCLFCFESDSSVEPTPPSHQVQPIKLRHIETGKTALQTRVRRVRGKKARVQLVTCHSLTWRQLIGCLRYTWKLPQQNAHPPPPNWERLFDLPACLYILVRLVKKYKDQRKRKRERS